MAVKFFYGFDFHKEVTTGSNFNSGVLTGTVSAATAWASLVKPSFMYHNRGLSTLDQTISPPNSPSSATRPPFCNTGGGAGGQGGVAYGATSSVTAAAGAYTGATTTTRATWNTAQGHQICFVRSAMNPALTGNEYWFTFDIHSTSLVTANLDSSYEATTSWKQIFRWGDVSVNAKTATYNASTDLHAIVLSIRNAGTEIATCTVQDLDCNASVDFDNPLTLIYCELHVKLDATTGIIEFYGNGVPQSVSYTNQNTVSVTPAASATEFYFGPPVWDNGTNAHVGLIDSILIDDAEFPAGRPTVRLLVLNSLIGATNVISASGGLLISSSTSYSDTNQMRFVGRGSTVYFSHAPVSAGLVRNSTALGLTGLLARCSNRYAPDPERKVKVNLDVSGVLSKDAYLLNTANWPYSSIVTPPETNGSNVLWTIFEKTDNSKYTSAQVGANYLRYTST